MLATLLLIAASASPGPEFTVVARAVRSDQTVRTLKLGSVLTEAEQVKLTVQPAPNMFLYVLQSDLGRWAKRYPKGGKPAQVREPVDVATGAQLPGDSTTALVQLVLVGSAKALPEKELLQLAAAQSPPNVTFERALGVDQVSKGVRDAKTADGEDAILVSGGKGGVTVGFLVLLRGVTP